jgi:CheY-like chemotaxis protein
VTHHRDPLLDTICDRIADLDRPAYVKTSELAYVAVNDAYARLFHLDASDLIAMGRGETPGGTRSADLTDKERACLVFGEDQHAVHTDPDGAGCYGVELERFTLADAQTFIYGVFNPIPAREVPQTLPESKAPAGLRGQTGSLPEGMSEYILDNMVAGICVYDADDSLIYFNRTLDDLYTPLIGPLQLGMKLDEVLERLADDNIRARPDDAELNDGSRDRWVSERVALQQMPFAMDMMPLSDGRWLQCINRRLPDGVFVGLRVDVTEMKERESLLKNSVKDLGLYRDLLTQLPVAAVIRGPDDRIHFANHAYAERVGRSREALLSLDAAGSAGEVTETPCGIVLERDCVTVESVDAAGARFTLSIQFQPVSVAAGHGSSGVDLASARILVIGGEEAHRANLLALVAEWGFEGVGAGDGPMGVAIMDEARLHGLAVDLVILDSQMSGLGGFDLARLIRANPAHAETAILLLTSEDAEHNLPTSGVQAQLARSARPEILRDAVTEVLNRTFLNRRPVLQPPPLDAHRTTSGREMVRPTADRPMFRKDIEVLVAEDNAINRIVFSQILDAAGISCRIVGNGAEAVEAWRRSRPSIILMDVSMPVMDGLTATEEIRRLETTAGGHVPIVGVTAHAFDGDRDMCLAAGMDDYLTKPISPESLEDKIWRWTARQPIAVGTMG